MHSHGRATRVLLLVTVLLCDRAALAANRFVAAAGVDGTNDCSLATSPCRTLQQALAAAANGDTIEVAKGHYPTLVTIAAPPTVVVTIEGGWTSDFGSRDVQRNVTMLRGGKQIPANGLRAPLTVVASAGGVVDLTLDGVTVTGGRNGGIEAAALDGMLTLTVAHDVVRANKASVYPGGGGILARAIGTGNLQLAVTDSTLQSNHAAHRPEGTGGPSGGITAIASQSSSLDLMVTRALFRQNRTDFFPNGGGAIAVLPATSGTVNVAVLDTTFLQNAATHAGGGAVEIDSSSSGPVSIDFTNTLFGGNKAGAAFGGGLAVDASASASTTLRLTNCTVADNFAPEGGGGITLAAVPTTLTNTIAWGNHVQGSMLAGDDLSASASVVDLDHDDIGVSFHNGGTVNDLGGNLHADPLLANAPKDLHLTAGSPCIDTGTCVGAPTTDFEGDVRPTGAGCDVGADEFVP